LVTPSGSVSPELNDARASLAGPLETGLAVGFTVGFGVGLRVGAAVGTRVGEVVGDGLAVGVGLADAVGEAANDVLADGLGLPVGELQPISSTPARATAARGRIGRMGARISPQTTRPNPFGLHRPPVAQRAPRLRYG
jgi:hypothetical protein